MQPCACLLVLELPTLPPLQLSRPTPGAAVVFAPMPRRRRRGGMGGERGVLLLQAERVAAAPAGLLREEPSVHRAGVEEERGCLVCVGGAQGSFYIQVGWCSGLLHGGFVSVDRASQLTNERQQSLRDTNCRRFVMRTYKRRFGVRGLAACRCSRVERPAWRDVV